MLSTLLELAGFALLCVSLFFLAGLWAGLVPVAVGVVAVGYMLGAPE